MVDTEARRYTLVTEDGQTKTFSLLANAIQAAAATEGKAEIRDFGNRCKWMFFDGTLKGKEPLS